MKHFAILLLLILLIVCVIGGFFLTLNRISVLEGSVERALVAFRLGAASSISDSRVVNDTSDAIPAATLEDEGTIPTAIIFNTLSSPLLKPRSNVAVIVEGVSRDSAGLLTVHLKVFTSEATSYSALNVGSIFELVDLSGLNQRVDRVLGSFDSMPPKKVVTGGVLFNTSPDTDTVILQLNTGEEIRHYEFDFEKHSYKEVVLG